MISCLLLVHCSYRCILWFQIGIKSGDYAMGECHIGKQDDSFQPTPGAVVQSDKVVAVQEPLKLQTLSGPDRHSCEIDQPLPLSCDVFPAFSCSRSTFMRVVGSIEFGIGLPKKCNLGEDRFLLSDYLFSDLEIKFHFSGYRSSPGKFIGYALREPFKNYLADFFRLRGGVYPPFR